MGPFNLADYGGILINFEVCLANRRQFYDLVL